jgi:hypothetical protein
LMSIKFSWGGVQTFVAAEKGKNHPSAVFFQYELSRAIERVHDEASRL